MRVEIRIFNRGKRDEKRHLILIPETNQESEQMDYVFSGTIPQGVRGIRTLSDGYGSDYIRLEKSQ